MFCCADKGAKDRGEGDEGTTKIISQEEGLGENKGLGPPVALAAFSGDGPATGASDPTSPTSPGPAAQEAPAAAAVAPEPAAEAPKDTAEPAPEPAKVEAPKAAPEPVKQEAPKAAVGPALEYTIMVSKNAGDVFGLSFDGMDDMAVVTEVKAGGVIDKFNQTAGAQNGLEKVVAGDRLLEVNGVGGNLKDLVTEMGKSDKLSIKFRRAQMWEIKVDKAQGLGLTLAHKEASSALFVGEVNAGAIMNWNKANPQAAVQKGDRILSANGAAGPAATVIGGIQSATGMLTLQFAR